MSTEQDYLISGEIAWKLVSVSSIDEDTGKLSVIEKGEHFDFNIKRLFFLENVPAQSSRGHHYHKELMQIIICLRGNFSLNLEYEGKVKTLHLDQSSKAVILNGPVWRYMDRFSKDALMLVGCDRVYSEDEVVYSKS